MTTKQAIAIVNGMTANLTGDALEAAITFAIAKAKLENSEANRTAITNEYRQHAWDVEDLASGEPAKAKKPAKTRKPAWDVEDLASGEPAKAKKPAKTRKAEGKPFPKPQGRTAKMFEHVLAGKSNAKALELIKKEFPGCPTNVNSIGWVRSQLRNNPKRWDGKFGVTLAKAKAVKADKDCK